jgi:hypothetical protein
MATAVPTQVTEYQTGFAPQLAPYAEKLLGRAEFYTNPSDPANQYQQYVDASGKPVQRVAQFTPLQQQSYTNAQNLGYDPYSVAAAQGMYGAAQQAMNYGYNPQQYSNQYQAPAQYNPGQFSYNQARAPNVNQYQMQGPQQAQGIAALSANQGRAPTSTAQQLIAAPTSQANLGASTASTAAQLGTSPVAQAQQGSAAQLGTSPEARAQAAQAAQIGLAPTMTGQGAQAAQLGAAPGQVGFSQVNAPQLRDLSMKAAGDIGTQSFAQPGSADAYMSPYMQSVVGVQQREAQRNADIATQSRNAQAVQAGAFGGSRRSIMDAEAARNLATQKGDIQATGSQAAYQQAQAQFNAEQSARLQAATSNQGVQQQANLQNLSAQLQQQGLGAQTGMQAQQLNQSAGLQTGLANQSLQGQYGLQQGQMNQQANLQTSAQAQQAAANNQALQGQYGMQQGQFGQQANLQTSAQAQQAALANQALAGQYGMQQGQFGQQMGIANLANQQQTSLANQALQGQYGMQQGQMNQQTGMANQQYANQFGLSNQAAQNQMALANQALAGQYGLQQGQFGQQTGLANQALAGQYGMQQGQFGQQANMQTAQNQQQAMLANQQMGYNVGNQNLQAMLATQQLGSGQNMQAQLANQQAGITTQQNQQQANQYGYGQQMASAQNMAQYGQANNQLNAQNAQYGAGLGLQGLQAGMTGYNNLGAMGSNLYNQNIGNMNAQNTFGTQQQNQAQNVLTNNYQDFLNQQNYPYKQMSFMSDMLRGAPLSQTGSSVYQAPPSMLSQVGGLGAMAYGQYLKAPGSKSGGPVKSYASGGLVQIALQKIMQD